MEYQIKQHPTLGISVSSVGEVLIPEYNGRPARWTKGSRSGDGYMQVQIRHNRYKVHRLIAETFIDNPEGKTEVDHINRNRGDNSVENLRWVTKSENRRNRADCDAVTLRGGTHYYQDTKRAYREQRAAYKLREPEKVASWFSSHNKLRFSDGKSHWVTREEADVLLKLPVSLRVYRG